MREPATARRICFTLGLASVVSMAILTAFPASAVNPGAVSGPEPGVPSDVPRLPSGVSAGSWSEVQREIQAAEYEITWQDETRIADLPAAWHAPNRKQDFRTYFTEKGIRVVPRRERQPAWEWGLELVGYGRGDRWASVDDARHVVDGRRIDFDRGNIIEWYVNDVTGLEQGFTLTRPPEALGAPASAPVHLDLALTGTLSPQIGPQGQTIDFVTPAGVRAVRYTELHVHDSTGTPLSARMEGFVRAGLRGIRIVVEDERAVYPLTVDPLAQNPEWTQEGNKELSYFGFALAAAGDVNGDSYSDVVVGAYGYDNGQPAEGRVFVYRGGFWGINTSVAPWTLESDQEQAWFGFSVATAGDLDGDGYSDILVGAPFFDSDVPDRGRVFVYHGSLYGIESTPRYVDGVQASSWFGKSVAPAGDVDGDGLSDFIVGAPKQTNGEPEEGHAFLYRGTAGRLYTRWWTAEPDVAMAYFGWSVATAGDVNADGYSDVVVGAYLYTDGEAEEGAAFVYHGSPLGLEANANRVIEGGSSLAHLGWSVAGAGDVNGDGYSDVVVGAPGYNDAGRAVLHRGSESGVLANASWDVDGDQQGADFGYAVATAGDVNGDGYADVIVGAPRYDGTAGLNEGRALLYQGSADGLRQQAAWTREGGSAGARFGHAVAAAGNVNGQDGYSDVLVGAPYFIGLEGVEGCAFAFHGGPAGLALTSDWSSVGESGTRLGHSVARAGDVNGDGFGDISVGGLAPGLPLVYHGSESGPGSEPDWNEFGAYGTTAGDVNGDGYEDFVTWGGGLYLGSPDGLATTPVRTLGGSRIASAGDVNGDGYSDVIVGDPDYDGAETDVGRVLFFHGSPDGIGTAPDRIIVGSGASSRFGYSVATAGDVDRDGCSDVIVGDWRQLAEPPWVENARAYVFLGSPDGVQEPSVWFVEAEIDNDTPTDFLLPFAAAGDVDGNGYADLIIGADAFENGERWEGRVSVYHAYESGLEMFPGWVVEGDRIGAHLGGSVAGAGDVNGDGYSDVIVGAPYNDHDRMGAALVYHGSDAGLSLTPDWSAVGDQPQEFFGESVSSAGDVNADGYADVLIGASGYSSGAGPWQGKAFLYYGNGGRGLSMKPQQRRQDDSAPIAPLCSSDAEDGFRVALLGRNPFGRGRVQLQWTTVGMGGDFGAIMSGEEWHDTGTGGVALNEQVTGLLESGYPYRWEVRLRYDPATSPFQPTSRWISVPWNGGKETDLRTAYPDRDGDGYSVRFDCDDLSGTVHPGAPQLCDGLDNDCANPGWPAVPSDETDDDGDGYVECEPWAGGSRGARGAAVIGGGDCDDTDSRTYPEAPEYNDARDNQCPGNDGYGVIDETSGSSGFVDPEDPATYSWPAQGGATLYEVARSIEADFSTGCTVTTTADALWYDPEGPLSGSVFFYLNRPLAPHTGSWGQDSSGQERTSVCP